MSYNFVVGSGTFEVARTWLHLSLIIIYYSLGMLVSVVSFVCSYPFLDWIILDFFHLTPFDNTTIRAAIYTVVHSTQSSGDNVSIFDEL